jgi:hypothetical protein
MNIDIRATPACAAAMVELSKREKGGNKRDNQSDTEAFIDCHY